jgi:hypothetical protein
MKFQIDRFLVSSTGSAVKTRAVFSFCIVDPSIFSLGLVTSLSHAAYSIASDADYYLFTQPCPGLPLPCGSIHQSRSGVTYNKLGYLRLLSDYHDVLYLDIDVLVSRKAPCIFDLYSGSRDSLVAWNESHLDPTGKGKAIKQVTDFLGGRCWPETIYLNSGVFLARPGLLALDELVPEKLFLGLWSEQSYLNWMLHNFDLSWLEMDRRYNCIVPLCTDEEIMSSYFWHFAGMTSPVGDGDANSYSHRTEYVKSFALMHSDAQYDCVVRCVRDELCFSRGWISFAVALLESVVNVHGGESMMLPDEKASIKEPNFGHRESCDQQAERVKTLEAEKVDAVNAAEDLKQQLGLQGAQLQEALEARDEQAERVKTLEAEKVDADNVAEAIQRLRQLAIPVTS